MKETTLNVNKTTWNYCKATFMIYTRTKQNTKSNSRNANLRAISPLLIIIYSTNFDLKIKGKLYSIIQCPISTESLLMDMNKILPIDLNLLGFYCYSFLKYLHVSLDTCSSTSIILCLLCPYQLSPQPGYEYVDIVKLPAILPFRPTSNTLAQTVVQPMQTMQSEFGLPQKISSFKI